MNRCRSAMPLPGLGVTAACVPQLKLQLTKTNLHILKQANIRTRVLGNGSHTSPFKSLHRKLGPWRQSFIGSILGITDH